MKFKNANQRRAVMAKLMQNKGRYTLQTDGKVLASIRVKKFGDEILNFKTWRTYVKGKGYGKELVQRIIKKNPDVYQINTNGLSRAGEANIGKALPEFKIIFWRTGMSGGIATLLRQDAIDYYIDKRKGRYALYQIDPKLRSKRKK